jgi:hypothetical protein
LVQFGLKLLEVTIGEPVMTPETWTKESKAFLTALFIGLVDLDLDADDGGVLMFA